MVLGYERVREDAPPGGDGGKEPAWRTVVGSVVEGELSLPGLWRSSAFTDEVAAWAKGVLAGRDVRCSGPLLVHRLTFWAGVFRLATDRGPVWVKVPNPGQAFEGPLLQVLARRAPDHVLAPVAVHPQTGWMLLPDGGRTVRETGPVTPAAWEAMVEQVAEMQLALVEHGEELTRSGLPVLLPQDAAAYVSSLVDELAGLPADHPQHLQPARAQELLRRSVAVADGWRALATDPRPATLQPNDTSPGNTFHSTGGRPFRFFDLGDAFWSHPFAVLQVPTRFASRSWPGPTTPGHPLVQRLRRAYGRRWEVDLGSLDGAELVEAADRLASLHRCESWRRLLAHVDVTSLEVPAPRLADWLGDALDPRP